MKDTFLTLKSVSIDDVKKDTPVSEMKLVYIGLPEACASYALWNGFTKTPCNNVFGYYYVKNAGKDNSECLLPDFATSYEIKCKFDEFNKIEKEMEQYENETPLVITLMRQAISRFNVVDANDIAIVYQTVYQSVGNYPEEHGWGSSDTSGLMHRIKNDLQVA